MIPDHSIRISIDTGGTFTDVVAQYVTEGEGGETQEMILKLLSSDPKHYDDAPREGVRRVLEAITGKPVPRGQPLSTDKIQHIRLATTVGTNALLERKGAKHALVTTKGFKDLLLIGNQSRPKIFDLTIQKPGVLYSQVLEVDERVTLEGFAVDPRNKERQVHFNEDGTVARGYDNSEPTSDVVRGISGEAVRILRKPDPKALENDLRKLYDDGFRSLAVMFLHSYTYPDHEQLVEKLASKIGFTNISLSSNLSSTIKAVSRGTSSTADAYLTPRLKQYIEGFFSGFDSSLRQGPTTTSSGKRTTVEFMTSDGGLTDVETFSGLKSILSGPAGGVVGAARTSWDAKRRTPVIAFDMGGTSSDLSRIGPDGRCETVFETTTAGITVTSPQLDVNTVAAGGRLNLKAGTLLAKPCFGDSGGSRLFYRNSLFVAGPESAGSDPGPACYRKNGPLAITDANLLLGRLVPRYFPQIFGDSEKEPLDVKASESAFDQLCDEINSESSDKKSRDEIAYGFLKIANETMCRPIRALTEARGYDTTKHILASFGGASGQHCCAIAKSLGISTVLVHRFSSVLSAYGMALSDRVYERREPCATVLESNNIKPLQGRVQALRQKVRQDLQNQGFDDKSIAIETYLNLRYNGTDTTLMTLEPEDGNWNGFSKLFEDNYHQEFGFLLRDRSIMVDDIRVRGVGKSTAQSLSSPFEEAEKTNFIEVSKEAAHDHVSVYFEECGRVDTPLFLLDSLDIGSLIKGPAMILQDTQTIVLEPGAIARVLSQQVLIDVA